ncbi:uncharacterized protein SPPG_07002 [Spizellomyces punctatus DAOM BR117]|uniref:Mediator of RNA polymerase II transcription subunit 18 n=1 Tax=Spizellomyces punctatus (strain DAOM BR117) TaxID=645134 RepID=A0A0L0H950_SPIPD|nr:uncharacterized protein SPPG_07002 [Spizellomyces punctatus DAOM BR117]KNC97526.1 hypothetical protein SPPG_07002 [Spizellomyces punctatus DAOM BR117]|eukprot:XP_016605566.1 hypothetical protein SPPG_07002 [Spizellomyces punctatus DAOM BR117]
MLSIRHGSWMPTLHQQIQALVTAQSASRSGSTSHPLHQPLAPNSDSSAGKNVQCSLHAHLPHSVLPKLFERLVGLCGAIDFDESQNLWEHEISFIPEVETPFGPARNDDTVLRLRANVLDDDGNFTKLHNRNWKICFFGTPELPKPGNRRRATQRVVYESEVKGDAFRYMEMLGYKFNFEFVRKGYNFTYRNLRIAIFRIYHLDTRHKVTSSVPVDGNDDSWIVEVTSPLTSAEGVPTLVDELHTFASHVAGLVTLVVVDHGALRNRIYY